jgi:hypothetical protein
MRVLTQGVASAVVGLFFVCGSAVLHARAQAQSSAVGYAPTLEHSVDEALQDLMTRAGVAFVGTVTKIERQGGVVAVTWNVEQALSGQPGRFYVQREWAGLWPAGLQRYRVGEHAMVFLHAPSAAGLSLPIDGMEGVVPVVPAGAQTGVNITTSPQPLLDVRLLSTRIERKQRSVLSGASGDGTITLAQGVEVVRQAPRSFLPAPLDPKPRPRPAPNPVSIRQSSAAEIHEFYRPMRSFSSQPSAELMDAR